MPRGELWRNREFLKLWTGQAVSNMGSAITNSALSYTAIYVLNASPIQMGYLNGANAAAVLVFGLFAGVWADRVRRRPILIGADLLRGAALAIIPLAAATNRLSLHQLYAVSAATGLLTVLFEASYRAYVPTLVGQDDLVDANSKLVLTESIPEIAGPGLAGLLVDWISAPMSILFDAFSFLASAVSLALIRTPEPRPKIQPAPQPLREIVEGLRVVWEEPVLRAIALRRATASWFFGFFMSLYMIFGIKDLGLSSAVLGTIISVGGAMSLCGALMVDRLVRRFGVGPTMIAGALLPGVGSLLLPLAHGSVGYCVAILGAAQLFDVAWPIYSVTEMSMRQAIAPAQVMGRVNASLDLLFRGILPAGALFGGGLAQAIGTRTALLLAAVGVVASTGWLLFSPIRRMRTLPTAPAPLKP